MLVLLSVLLECEVFLLDSIISNVTTFVTSAVAWVGSTVDCITNNALLLSFTIVSFVGLGVGLIKRIIRM